jgi:hypothetical protein
VVREDTNQGEGLKGNLCNMKTILEQFNGKNNGAKKTFQLIHKIDISNEFVNCADIQLTNYFEKEMSININKGINMFLSSDRDDLVYEKGVYSKLNAKVFFLMLLLMYISFGNRILVVFIIYLILILIVTIFGFGLKD